MTTTSDLPPGVDPALAAAAGAAAPPPATPGDPLEDAKLAGAAAADGPRLANFVSKTKVDGGGGETWAEPRPVFEGGGAPLDRTGGRPQAGGGGPLVGGRGGAAGRAGGGPGGGGGRPFGGGGHPPPPPLQEARRAVRLRPGEDAPGLEGGRQLLQPRGPDGPPAGPRRGLRRGRVPPPL